MFTTDPNTLITQAAAFGSSLDTAVAETVRTALEQTKARVGPGAPLIDRLEQGDPVAHEHFRYALALRISAYLSLVDGTVRSVHVVDATADVLASPVTERLQLLIVVERKTAALDSLLAELDAALTQAYRQLLAPRADAMTSLLVTMLVDVDEAASRQGLGSLLHSLHCPPVRVWAR